MRDSLRDFIAAVPNLLLWLLRHTTDAAEYYIRQVALRMGTAVGGSGSEKLSYKLALGRDWAMLESLLHSLSAVSKKTQRYNISRR